MRRLCRFSLPFCAAVALSRLIADWQVSLLLALIAAVGAGIALLPALRRRGLVPVLLGACLGFGWFWGYSAVSVAPLQALADTETAFTATVTGYPSASNYSLCVTATITGGDAEGETVLLWLSTDYADLKPGDTLSGTAAFTWVAGTDSEGSGYASRGIFLAASVTVEQVYSAATVPLRYLPAYWGHRLKQAAAELFDSTLSPLMTALLTGDKSGLSDLTTSDFSRAGMSHLLAVSGLHVGFLSGLLYLLPGNRRRRGLIAIPLLIFFALATGAQPSVWRATVMTGLLLLAPLFHREADAPTSLSFALLLLLVQNPYAIAGVGLQLSFASMGGLVLFYPAFHRRLISLWPKRPHGRIRRMAYKGFLFCSSALSAGCAAMVLTLPLCAWYFGRVSLVGPITNLIAVPVASAAFVLGFFACGLYGFLPGLARLLAIPAGLAVRLLSALAAAFGRLNWSALELDNLWFQGWFGAFVFLLLLVVLLRPLRRRPLLPLLTATAMLLIALTGRMSSMNGDGLVVTALDVGQGACTVFSSRGTFTAVDCGGEDAGNRLADYVQSAGSSTLSLLVLTHLDEDHISGLSDLFTRLQVETLAIAPPEEDETWDTVLALAQAEGCTIVEITENTTCSFGSATLTVFARVTQSSDNEGCLAVLCSYGEHHVLVTGDLPQAQELLLLERETLPRLDILIVGHHGSASSTSARLLAQLSPATAVISVGSNLYGHPSDTVLTRLAQYRTTVYRTDEDGTLIFRFSP